VNLGEGKEDIARFLKKEEDMDNSSNKKADMYLRTI
jgi:hypothetical protein